MKCSIDSNTREIIFLDNSECFGVEFDKNTQRIEFSCPKIVGDNLDLTKCTCRINYMNAKGCRDSYLIDDILVDGDNITFTWALKSKVTAGRGVCLFIFCARQVTETGVIEKEWNTTVAKASIKRGLETNSHIEEEYSDILESILLKINSVSLTTDVNAESTNENVPTAKAVYDALQNIDIPSGTDISLNVTGATVGQTIKVKVVDADGKPTAWEAVDMAAGDTEVWEELTHFVGTADSPVNSVKQTFPAGAYKKIYIVGHIVLSGTNNPVIYIDSDHMGVPKVFENQATSGTFRVLIEAFGTGVAVYVAGRMPDNQFAWNGSVGTTTKNDTQMIDIAFVEVYSGHNNTTFAEGTDFIIYGVKA